MEDEERYTLDNGFEVRWWPTEDPVTCANLVIRAGSLNETPGENGLAHFLEHCVAGAGAPGFTPERDWSVLTSKLGYANWKTGQRFTIAQGSFLQERLPLFIDYVSSHTLTPTFDPLGVENERKAVLREIADHRSAPDDGKSRAVAAAIYRGHPALHNGLGDEMIVKNATIDDLRAIHARWYTPANMALLVAGPRPADARQRIEDAFGTAAPGSRLPSLDLPVLDPIGESQVFRFPLPKGEHHAPSANLYCSVIVPPSGTAQEATIDVLTAILESRDRLSAALRSGSGIAYSVKADIHAVLNTSVLTVSSKVDALRADESLVRIVREFNRLQEDPIADEELDDLRYLVRYQAASSFLTPLGKLQSLLHEFVHDRPYLSYLDQMSTVTPQQIQDVAQAHLPRNLDERHVTSIWSQLYEE